MKFDFLGPSPAVQPGHKRGRPEARKVRVAGRRGGTKPVPSQVRSAGRKRQSQEDPSAPQMLPHGIWTPRLGLGIELLR